MGIAGSSAPKGEPGAVSDRTATSRVPFSQGLLAFLFMVSFWLIDSALDSVWFGEGDFSELLLSPPSHELADRALVIILGICFICYSGLVNGSRSSLEGPLEEALAKAEDEKIKLAAVLEAMGDAISIQDPDLNVIYQNRRHQENMGLHLGEPCYQAYRHQEEPCSGCHLLAAFSDGEMHTVEISTEGEGRTRYAEIVGSAVKDRSGRIVAGIEVVRDVTTRKAAELAVWNEAALLQHLIDTIPNPIFYKEPTGRFVWCNTAFAEWLDKPRELIIGRSISEVAPAQVSRVFRGIEPDLERGTVQECSLQHADGGVRDVIFYKSVFREASGERGGVVGVIIDITTRTRAEQEIVGLNAALTQQAVELHQFNRDLESFSHAISHDLRTPLTRIYSSAQALQECQELLDDNGRFFVSSINEGCEQMVGLLDALMVLSRVGELEFVADQVDLTRLAQDKAAELSRSEPERRALFNIEPQLCGEGDRRLLSIVMDNLIGNAWKYSSKVDEPLIEIGSFTSAEGEPVFFIRDNGAGFDSRHADQLFKPFRRLHSSHEFPGTGLGLATVRRIIRRHNGRVWGEGIPGTGASFYFTLNG
jgi:PAS domain S-box-containing protein